MEALRQTSRTNVHATNKRGATPLHYACKCGHLNVVHTWCTKCHPRALVLRRTTTRPNPLGGGAPTRAIPCAGCFAKGPPSSRAELGQVFCQPCGARQSGEQFCKLHSRTNLKDKGFPSSMMRSPYHLENFGKIQFVPIPRVAASLSPSCHQRT